VRRPLNSRGSYLRVPHPLSIHRVPLQLLEKRQAEILRNRLQTLKSCAVQYLRRIRAGNVPVRVRYPPTKFARLAHLHAEEHLPVLSVSVQNRCSESPLVERERTKSPDTQIYGQQQPNLASANGLTFVHGAKTSSVGNVTTDLIRDVKVRDVELEMLRRREAWMKAALSQAMHAGFVYVNANLGDEDRGVTDEQPKIAEAVITLKKLHGHIQVGKLAVSVRLRDVELRCPSFRRLLLNRHAMRRCALVRPNSNGLCDSGGCVLPCETRSPRGLFRGRCCTVGARTSRGARRATTGNPCCAS
jgi:hypothetical protein